MLAAVFNGEGQHRSESPVRSVLEQVYREHRQGLFTLALTITRCPYRAEDAVQEAMVRLWQSAELPRDPLPYVFAAVRNAAIDQMRRTAARRWQESASIYEVMPAAAGPTSGGGPEDPAAAAISAEQHARLRRAVDALPQPEREVVVMRIYGGLKFEQIAEALDEPLPTVASRYRRALDTLGRRIKAVMEAPHE
jgi:RNA polymerase sigma-70 factor (ECF subfamily)